MKKEWTFNIGFKCVLGWPKDWLVQDGKPYLHDNDNIENFRKISINVFHNRSNMTQLMEDENLLNSFVIINIKNVCFRHFPDSY